MLFKRIRIQYNLSVCILLLSYTACMQVDGRHNKQQNNKTLSSMGQQLMVLERKIHDVSITLLYKQTLNKIPFNADALAAIQLSAVDYGSKKSMQKQYDNIVVPDTNNNRPVRYLDLSEQNIYFIPDKISAFSQLQYLSINNNFIKAINPKLAYCTQLKKLDLSSNGIQKIPTGILHLHQVENLVLSDNLLTDLPQSLIQLKALRSLDISNHHASIAAYNNQFEKLPSVLFKMKGLQKLFLDNLTLQLLPAELNRMDSLKVLSLKGNRLLQMNNLFETLSKAPQIQVLDISFIGRKSLPPSVQLLKHLKVLIWYEENQMNKAFVETQLRQLLPNTSIFYGKSGVQSPFLRGNSIKTIIEAR